jgi:ABC-type ATPase involved in cell division
MVKFFHVARSYGGREVLADVSLTIGNGEAVIVSGAGGAGKTTLVRLLLGLERPSRGSVTVDGLVVAGSAPDVLAAHRRRIGLVPQAPTLLPERDVADNVALAQEVAGVPTEEARQGALRTLERLGLDAMADRRVAELSAAERRWVAVARAFGRSDASLLVVDEPAADLGADAAGRLGLLLEQEREIGKTVLVLSRAPELDGLGAHRVAFLDAGRITLDVCAPELTPAEAAS